MAQSPDANQKQETFLSFKRYMRAWRQVPTWFIGEASPLGIEDPFGMNNNECPSTGPSLGNTLGIARQTEKGQRTPLGSP